MDDKIKGITVHIVYQKWRSDNPVDTIPETEKPDLIVKFHLFLSLSLISSCLVLSCGWSSLCLSCTHISHTPWPFWSLLIPSHGRVEGDQWPRALARMLVPDGVFPHLGVCNDSVTLKPTGTRDDTNVRLNPGLHNTVFLSVKSVTPSETVFISLLSTERTALTHTFTPKPQKKKLHAFSESSYIQ